MTHSCPIVFAIIVPLFYLFALRKKFNHTPQRRLDFAQLPAKQLSFRSHTSLNHAWPQLEHTGSPLVPFVQEPSNHHPWGDLCLCEDWQRGGHVHNWISSNIEHSKPILNPDKGGGGRAGQWLGRKVTQQRVHWRNYGFLLFKDLNRGDY